MDVAQIADERSGFGGADFSVAPIIDQRGAEHAVVESHHHMDQGTVADGGDHIRIIGHGSSARRGFVAPLEPLLVVIGTAGRRQGDIVFAFAAATRSELFFPEGITEVENPTPGPSCVGDGEPSFQRDHAAG